MSDFILEEVPPFTKRPSDRVIHGSNNNTIILGTDRAKNGEATIGDGLGTLEAEGEGKGTGTIHLVVGRSTENPNLDTDEAFVYISRKTEVDNNLQTNQEFSTNKKSSVAVKADCVRIVGREDVKVVNGESYLTMKSDGTIIVHGKKIVMEGEVQLGRDAAENIIRGPAFQSLFNRHTHPCPTGVTSRPTQQMSSAQMSDDKYTK